MINWIRKKFGYHVCEEWTQWEKKTGHYIRTHNVIGNVRAPRIHRDMAGTQMHTLWPR